MSCAISDHNAGTIIATIFESLETMFEDRESVFMSFVGEYSAHGEVCKVIKPVYRQVDL